jgi:hypothetical protein
MQTLIDELRATRETLLRTQEDHEARLRHLEKKSATKDVVISGVTSIVAATVTALVATGVL